MKSFYTLFFILFTTVFFNANAQQTHTITLTCKSSELTDDNVNDLCSFGQDPNIPNKDYLIEAQLSDTIKWNANYSEQDQGYIDIARVDYDSGVNIFRDRHIFDDTDGLVNGTIVAIVKKGDAGNELKYSISFDVYNKLGNFVGRFKIDPKIKIKQISVSNEIERN